MLAWPGSSIRRGHAMSNRMFRTPSRESTRLGYPDEFEICTLKRYYFHLIDGTDVILDDEGIEVADLATARLEVIKAIHEFRRECPAAATEWTGWRIEVTDEMGFVALVIDVSDLAEDDGDRSVFH